MTPTDITGHNSTLVLHPGSNSGSAMVLSSQSNPNAQQQQQLRRRHTIRRETRVSGGIGPSSEWSVYFYMTVKSCGGSCWSSQDGGLVLAHAPSADGYEVPNGTGGSLTHPGPRESPPLEALEGGASGHLTQLCAADGKDLVGLCSLARSPRTSGRLSAPSIRMAISYSPNLPCTCVRSAERQTKKETSIVKAMMTMPALAAPLVETAGESRHYRAR